MYVKIPDKGFHFSADSIRKIEDMYKAKYMGHWCTKTPSGIWNEMPLDVFYQPNPKVEEGHTHYFGLYRNYAGEVRITSADSAFSDPIVGVLCEDGEVIVSRYRHDYQEKDGKIIDGGRDYLKTSIGGQLVNITVDKDQFICKVEEK